MAIKIITDSSCDISIEEAKSLNIEVLPITIFIDDKAYKDMYGLSIDDFYKKLKEEALPKTSQINSHIFEANFKESIENGDQVLGIFISSELSGTYQSATIAKDSFEDGEIELVDSKNVSIGLQYLVRYACQLRDKNKTLEEIKNELEEIKSRIKLITVIEDLIPLARGGRLSTSGAFLGNMLSIKPILECINGKMEVIEKVRGTKKAYERIFECAIEEGAAATGFFIIAHADCEDKCDILNNSITRVFSDKTIFKSRIGACVGTYTGPLCSGLAFLSGK